MVFIQCRLTGRFLSWYICLNDTYKQDWHAFVQAFKKQFSSQKNAYYAQVEALNLTKKDNETVRHYAPKIQQLVEKGWCNEHASTINLKCYEILTKGLTRNLKGFTNKRQVKHTSTVSEPSIPFHTLVKLVDAEDIANDKIRTYYFVLELIKIINHSQTQTFYSSEQEQLLFTQPRDPNNKNKPAFKKYCSYCHRTNHSISACFKNQQDDEDKRDAYARNLNSHLYSTFVLPQTTEQKDMIHALEVEVLPGLIITTKTLIHKTDIALHQEIDSILTKILLLHYILDHDMTTINAIHDLIGLLTDLLRDSYPYGHDSRHRYRSRSYSSDTNNFTRYTSSYRPPSRPRDSRYSRSRSHSNTRNKFNTLQPQHQNDPINFEVHM